MKYLPSIQPGSDTRSSRPLAIVVVAGLIMSSCVSQAPKTVVSSRPIRSSDVARLRGNELRYGVGYTQVAGVVYQPDTVMIGGGATSVRRVSAAGLTWTLDDKAPGVDKLAVGKIMLATSFGTGRVLRLTRSAGEVHVVLGPVAITEVFRDADLGSLTPIPIKDVLAYVTPAAPGTVSDGPQGSIAALVPTGSGNTNTVVLQGSTAPELTFRTHPARLVGFASGDAGVLRTAGSVAPGAQPPPLELPAPFSTPVSVGAGDFALTPICCAGGIGIQIGYDHGGGRLQATVKLKMTTPTVAFHLRVSGGKLLEATVRIQGGVALRLALEAATLTSAGSFAGKRVHVPETLTIPLTGFGVPVVLSFNQDFYLSMQLAGKASFGTFGEYRVAGDLGFGYRSGGPKPDETKLSVQFPMTEHTHTEGVASGAVLFGWTLKASVGVGVEGFNAGVWYQLNTNFGVAANTMLSLPALCVTDSVKVTGLYGVGWTIPAFVANTINALLSIFGSRRIAATGGPWWGPTVLWNPPDGNYCPT